MVHQASAVVAVETLEDSKNRPKWMRPTAVAVAVDTNAHMDSDRCGHVVVALAAAADDA